MSLVDYQSSSSDDEEKTISSSSQLKLDLSRSLKRKDPVKICVPTIKEYDDDKVEPSKKPKTMSVAGLLGMLPKPKFSAMKSKTNMLIPDVLNRKKKTEPDTSKIISKTPKTLACPPAAKVSDQTETVEDEDDNYCGTNFFSIQSEPSKTISLPRSYPSEIPSSNKTVNIISNVSNPVIEISPPSFELKTREEPSSASTGYYSPEPTCSTFDSVACAVEESAGSSFVPPSSFSSNVSVLQPDILNDEKFKRLQGRKRGGFEDINIIDVNVDSQLVDKTEWLTKPLTEEKNFSHSRKKGNMPTSQQRRKHQITYLAFQAKERELDLKNQWAQNRLTKRETQAKYGF